jgi:NAD(P)H-dependent FMN reductase
VDELRGLRPRPHTLLRPSIEDQGNPEPVKELREKIRAYDAVLIATPEYDYAIPGLLIAALD